MNNPHRVELSVRYAETDQMGVAHHGVYPAWLELGRCAWLRELGFPYGRMEADGFLLPVTKLSIHYLRPAKFEDRLAVETVLKNISRATLEVGNRILKLEPSGAEILLAEASVELACITPQGKVQRLPERLRQVLEPIYRQCIS